MSANRRMLLFESDVKRLEEISSFILEHLGNDLTAAMIAKEFRIGKSTLHRHFKVHFKLSLHRYILKCRMEKAMELIVTRSCNITQAGTAVGFKEASSFTRAFINHFGHPPKSYFREQDPL